MLRVYKVLEVSSVFGAHLNRGLDVGRDAEWLAHTYMNPRTTRIAHARRGSVLSSRPLVSDLSGLETQRDDLLVLMGAPAR